MYEKMLSISSVFSLFIGGYMIVIIKLQSSVHVDSVVNQPLCFHVKSSLCFYQMIC